MAEPIRTIVAGVVDVGGPDPVLELALRIARHQTSALHAVHSYIPPDTAQGLGLGGMDYTGLAGVTPVWSGAESWDLAGALEERLRGQIASLGGYAALHVQVIPGSAASAIRDVAEEVAADLVLVGASRRGGLERAFLGTTAGSVLRDSLAPVLVAREPFPSRGGHVLLTTDLTDSSADVCARGIALATAILDSEPISFTCLHVRAEDLEEDADSPGGHSLDDVRRFVRQIELPGLQIEPLLEAGVPVEVIRSQAESRGVDLVVLGTHARKGMARLFLGSVAATAVREVPCSALVIPPAAD